MSSWLRCMGVCLQDAGAFRASTLLPQSGDHAAVVSGSLVSQAELDFVLSLEEKEP